MNRMEKTILGTALMLAMSAGAVFAETGEEKTDIPKLEGKAVEKDKIKKKGPYKKIKPLHFDGKGVVSGGAVYLRLPKEIVKNLRAMGDDVPENIGTVYGLKSAGQKPDKKKSSLAIRRMKNMIKTPQNVILTLGAGGSNNEAMLNDADRKALALLGAKEDKNGAIQARGYLRIEGLPAGETITIVVTHPKKAQFNFLVTGGKGSKDPGLKKTPGTGGKPKKSEE